MGAARVSISQGFGILLLVYTVITAADPPYDKTFLHTGGGTLHSILPQNWNWMHKR